MNMAQFFFVSRNNPRAAKICYQSAVEQIPYNAHTVHAQKKIEEIDNGRMPEKRVIDYFIGRYQPETVRDFIQEAQVDDRDADRFVGRDDRDLPAEQVGQFVAAEEVHAEDTVTPVTIDQANVVIPDEITDSIRLKDEKNHVTSGAQIPVNVTTKYKLMHHRK